MALVAVGVLVPLAYLLLRALEAEPSEWAALVVRARNLRLLGHTLALTAGVLAFATALALPLAWLATRADVRGRRLLTLLGVLPLAVPGYVMAYALLAATGTNGLLALALGLELPRVSGYAGALLALGLYTFPYLFLNLRAALLGLDPALEEAARSLGHTRREVALRVVLPQLRPAYLAGALLVALHVLGDFGVVSLMRYETFSYALYVQYAAAYDRVYAAWLALMLLALTGTLLWLEARLLRGRRFARAAGTARRTAPPAPLGRWRLPAYAFAGAVALFSIGLPLVTVSFWLLRADTPAALADGRWLALASALADSVRAALPAALLAALLAVPLAYLSVRHPSRTSRAAERVAYLGYATPPLAFALAFVFFALRTAPFAYQTLGLLVAAYALHFLAEAIGPVRSALYQAPPAVEWAARSLGRSAFGAFRAATLPLVRRGMLASAVLVFLSAVKELPIAFILSPLGFRTLAMGVWSATGEALYSLAAPYALALIASSGALVGLVLSREGRF
ncbi:MAG: ABC transporter permease [Rubricoccaceae bacterium]